MQGMLVMHQVYAAVSYGTGDGVNVLDRSSAVPIVFHGMIHPLQQALLRLIFCCISEAWSRLILPLEEQVKEICGTQLQVILRA